MSIEQQPGRHDHESDPARTPGDGWVDEGGASHLGPATHLSSGQHRAEDEADEAELDEEE